MSHRTLAVRAPLAGAAFVALVALAACGDDGLAPDVDLGTMRLTAAQVHALDSTSTVITTANPGNADLQSLVDSTLRVLAAGVEARRLPATTSLTSAPLYFVGIHRVQNRAGGSWSTWTVVGFDDPARLTRLVEVAGFAQNATATAPATARGTIGDGTGMVNGLLLQVAPNGAVTEWRATGGGASFTSGAAGAACPGFVPTATVTCNLETMRVSFTLAASGALSGGPGAQDASLPNEVDVPTMRLTFTPPR